MSPIGGEDNGQSSKKTRNAKGTRNSSTTSGGGSGSGGRDQSRGRRSQPAPPRPTTNTAGGPLHEMPPESLRSPRLRDTLFEFATGRQAPAKALGNIAAMLRTTYGASARNPERPDLKAAAAGLGMSVRQLQRWVRGETTPRADNPRLQKLRRQTSAVVNTKRGRKQALRNAASARPPSAPKITVTGVQGRRSDNLEQYRPRSCSTTLSDEEFNTFQDLWAEHGPAGAADWLHAHFDANYLADWHFLDIDEIKWSD